MINLIKSRLEDLALFIAPKRLSEADIVITTSNIKKVREIFPEPPFQDYDEKNPTIQLFMSLRRCPEKRAQMITIGDVSENTTIAFFLQLRAFKDLQHLQDITEWLKLKNNYRSEKSRSLRDDMYILKLQL